MTARSRITRSFGHTNDQVNVTAFSSSLSGSPPSATVSSSAASISNSTWRFLSGAGHFEGVSHDARVAASTTSTASFSETENGFRGTNNISSIIQVEDAGSRPGGSGYARLDSAAETTFRGSCLGGSLLTSTSTSNMAEYSSPNETHSVGPRRGTGLPITTGSSLSAVGESTTVSWEYQKEDPRAMLNRGNLFHSIGGANNNTFIGEFRPRNSNGDNIDAQCFAGELGFDTFNWIQHFTVPQDWTMVLFRSTGNGTSVVADRILPNRILDPHNLGPDFIMGATRDLNGDGDNADPDEIMFINHEPVWDRLTPYYDLNEVPSVASGLVLNDAPHIADYFFRPGDELRFESELVGINVNGSNVSITPLGVGFRWTSDARGEAAGSINGGIGNVAPLRNHDHYDVTAGGIYNVETYARTVPEPNGSVLLLFLAGIVSNARRNHLRLNRG